LVPRQPHEHRRHFVTVIVIFFEATSGVNGVCVKSANSNCSVCLPGGKSSVASVWPLPKWRMLSVAGSGCVRSAGRPVSISRWWCPVLSNLTAGRRDAHALEAEHHGDRAFDPGAVGRLDDVDLGAGGRWRLIGQTAASQRRGAGQGR
jgi:hypothetical protein